MAFPGVVRGGGCQTSSPKDILTSKQRPFEDWFGWPWRRCNLRSWNLDTFSLLKPLIWAKLRIWISVKKVCCTAHLRDIREVKRPKHGRHRFGWLMKLSFWPSLVNALQNHGGISVDKILQRSMNNPNMGEFPAMMEYLVIYFEILWAMLLLLQTPGFSTNRVSTTKAPNSRPF